jgi:hypothetical protein
MSADEVEVEVDQAEEAGAGAAFAEEEEEPRRQRRRRRTGTGAVEVEIEREVTKRQLIQSISTVLVVILYMVFTLMRDRDAGVVVLDPDDPADDWDE